MSDTQAQIYLIAGASRGIGLALVADIACKDPTAIIYAGVRTPIGSSASKLEELATKYPGRIEIVKYVAADKEGNDTISKSIGEKHGRVDTVVVNAGIMNVLGTIHETPIDQFQDHFSVNALGPIVLFQSVRSLLKASPHPRFVPISSGVGSIEIIPTMPIDCGAYGTSKVALNWVTRKIHFENEWLVSFPLCPGAVETDLAHQTLARDTTGKSAVLKDVWRSPDVAASMLVDLISVSTRENNGGQFNKIEGDRYPW